MVVALLGSTGSGKTSLVNLLPRFYDVTSGQILLDGTDIRELRINDLRSLMGIVTQDSILFNDTIANNIAFGKPGTSESDVKRAAEIANADGFISQLESGYQTNIGDGGNRLSGGQKQRIAIARALLRDPQLLVLDEATSALDSEVEASIQAALGRVMEGKTVLAIAIIFRAVRHPHQGDTVIRQIYALGIVGHVFIVDRALQSVLVQVQVAGLIGKHRVEILRHGELAFQEPQAARRLLLQHRHLDQGFSRPRDHEGLALQGALDQLRQMRLGFVDVDLFHVRPR